MKRKGMTAEMQRLTSLSLAHELLETLPTELETLPLLLSLDVSCNALMTLDHLPVTLVELNASDNKLSDLPPEFARLQSLRKIRLSKNRFTVFPAVLGRLNSLENVTLFRNEIAVLPEVADVSSDPARVKVGSRRDRGPSRERDIFFLLQVARSL